MSPGAEQLFGAPGSDPAAAGEACGPRAEGAVLPLNRKPWGESCPPPTHGGLPDQEPLPFSVLPELLPSVSPPCCRREVLETSSSGPLLK